MGGGTPRNYKQMLKWGEHWSPAALSVLLSSNPLVFSSRVAAPSCSADPTPAAFLGSLAR